jgi:large repetitive protein
MNVDQKRLVPPDVLQAALAEWLADEAPRRAPIELRETVMAATAHMPQRSPWLRLPLLDGRTRRLGAALASGLALVVVAAALVLLSFAPDPGPAGPITPAGSMAHPRAGHSATLLANGRVLIVGGSQRHGSTADDVEDVAVAELWDPRSRTFSPAGSLMEPRSGHTATLLPDGRVLIVGGGRIEAGREGRWMPIAAAEIWDPRSRSFIPAGSLNQPLREHTATLLPDGRVLIVGSLIGRSAQSEIWDPATGTFNEIAQTTQRRGRHTATLLPDGRVLIAGGGPESRSATTELWDPLTEEFGDGPSMIEARAGATAVLLADGRVLLIGGNERSASTVGTAELLDAAAGEFTPTGEFGPFVGHVSPPAAALPDGRVVVFGPEGSIELWHPETLSFTHTGDLPESRTLHTATTLPDGRVLIVGGYGNHVTYSQVLGSAVLYDPAAEPETPTRSPDPAGAGSFSAAAPLSDPRPLSDATRLPDGRVLLFGGYRDQAPGECEELRGPPVHTWDPSSERFEQLPGLPEPREAHTLVPLPDGRLLVVGGSLYRRSDEGCLNEPTTNVTLWDPLTNITLPAGSLREPRISPGGVALADGRVLVFGGTEPEESHDPHPERLASAEVWDPSTNSFTLVGPMADARSSATATLLADGRVLVVGGVGVSWECDGDPDDFTGYSCTALRPALASAEVWDSGTGLFTQAGSLAAPRTGHTATLLADGRVLIIGGRADDDSWRGPDHVSAEIWDPATDNFRPAGTLPEPRPLHTATLLDDGPVLVVGGAQSLVWDPASGEFAGDAWLAEPRLGHSAAPLSDGSVLIVGGIVAKPGWEYLLSAEIYQPVAPE